MELRTLTQDDRPAIRPLMAEAFGRGRHPAPDILDKPLPEGWPDSLRLGLFDGPRLVACAAVHPLPVTWGERDITLGGMAAVACAADQRGRGHVARLLSECLHAMREQGQALSGLYPFSWTFYHKHGWAAVGDKRTVTVPLPAVPRFPEGVNVRMSEGSLELVETLKPIYAAFARCYRSMTTRAQPFPAFWKSVVETDDVATYVHIYHDPATGDDTGYLVVRFPEHGSRLQVREFVALTPDAYRGLLSILHGYGTQMEMARWSAPTNHWLPLYVSDWDLKARAEPLFMGRVVDVSAALEQLTPPINARGTVTLQLADPVCDWNNGTFAVSIEAGSVTVAPTRDTPGVTLDIQTLAQAYWGSPSMQPLRAGGRVTVADETQFQTLSALLPPALCYLADDF